MVLARYDWSGPRSNCEREMGRIIHNRLGWKLDPSAIMGTAGRRQDRDSCKFFFKFSFPSPFFLYHLVKYEIY